MNNPLPSYHHTNAPVPGVVYALVSWALWCVMCDAGLPVVRGGKIAVHYHLLN